MASGAIFAQGTELQMSDSAFQNHTPIAEILTITGPTMNRDQLDVTNQGSTGGFREFINGLINLGSLSFSINYIPTAATHDAATGLLDVFESGEVREFNLVFPDGGNTTWVLRGIVNGFEVSVPVDAQLTADITIVLTGVPTFA